MVERARVVVAEFAQRVGDAVGALGESPRITSFTYASIRQRLELPGARV